MHGQQSMRFLQQLRCGLRNGLVAARVAPTAFAAIDGSASAEAMS